MPAVGQATERALAYLRGQQQADGSFVGYSSRRPVPFRAEFTYRTTFLPAVLLGALQHVPGAGGITGPLARWLMAQRSPRWSFNYWAAAAPERATMPYPDDLDDTFCALGALRRHDAALVDAAALGRIVALLLAAETTVGGPYRTWLVGRDAPAQWQDVDLAVNCNIAYFLQQVAAPLPNLTALMDAAIAGGQCTSPYYPGALPVLYYLARAYRGTQTAALQSLIQTAVPANALQQALRGSALVRAGGQPAAADRRELLAAQQPDGSWPAAAFCLDAARDGATHYHGSAALSTAFALEALQLQTEQATASARRPAAAAAPADRHAPSPAAHAAVARATNQLFAPLPPDLRGQLHHMAGRLAAGDASQEVLLLPHIFAASLAARPTIPDKVLQQLGIANLCGWIAYTIYDDFLDGEGRPPRLPAASTALRASVQAFAVAVPDSAFQRTVQQAFDTIDGANTWEALYCRFTITDGACQLPALPRFGRLQQLAQRSLGHALTPLAILHTQGYPPGSLPARHIHQALRHYLIARQLLDDLRDYEDDLRAGRLSAVGTALLRQLRAAPGAYPLDSLLPRARRAFWQHTLPVMCQRAGQHLARCRQSLAASQLLGQATPLHALVDRLAAMQAEQQQEQRHAVQFLAAYQKPPV